MGLLIALDLKYTKGMRVVESIKDCGYYVGIIDGYDAFDKKYHIFLGDEIGSDWADEDRLLTIPELKEFLKNQHYKVLDNFNKATLNKIIKWTSSKFNSFRKSEVIKAIYSIKDGNVMDFECGSYGEKSWCGGITWCIERKGCIVYIIRDGSENERYAFVLKEN